MPVKSGAPKLSFKICITVLFFPLLVLLITVSSNVYAENLNFSSVINPDEYMIGPGDKFRIDFWDGTTNSIDVTVTPEGSILIESMGRLEVGNLSLTKARAELIKTISCFYSVENFSISLIGNRQVKILITGGVKTPGLYDGYVSNRVSEIITRAGGLINGSSKRNIKLLSGEKERKVDLLRFERIGDLESNPYLYSGNIIYVPLVSDSSSFVHISGEVINPDGFEFKSGDDFGTIIDLAYGYTGLESDSVIVFRRTNGQHKTFKISTREKDFEIHPSDKFIVGRQAKPVEYDNFSITGEVAIPGRYPWENGTNLEKALEKCGRTTKIADIYSLTIYRKTKFTRKNETSQVLSNTNLNNLSFYQACEPVSVKIDQFYPNRLDEIDIFPGDSLVVPKITGSIGIYGMVKAPGMILYDRPRSAIELIKKAGGYSVNADRRIVQVLRKTTGIRITAKPDITVYDGDTVIIPELRNKKSMWDKVKDISLILGGLGAAWLALDNITD